jgi:hypothetical protein
MLYFSAALALLLSVKAPPVHAQQITRVLPFAGTHSETWEPFGVQEIPLVGRFPNYSSGLVSERIRNSGIDGDLIPVNRFGDDKGGNRRGSGTHRNASGTEG